VGKASADIGFGYKVINKINFGYALARISFVQSSRCGSCRSLLSNLLSRRVCEPFNTSCP
jgi:hypothetical protein